MNNIQIATWLLIRVVYALRFLIVKAYAKADAGSLCTEDDDCPDQMICSNGFCMPAIPTRNRCYSEHHCSYQERCRYQTCWTIMYIQCRKDADCIANLICRYGFCDVATDMMKLSFKQRPCATHLNCPGTEICIDEMCEQAEPTGDACYNDEHCKSELSACKFGQCWRHGRPKQEVPKAMPITQSPPRSTIPLSGGSCTNHFHCTETAICLKSECKEAEPTRTRCTSDLACPQGGACKYKFCWSAIDNNKNNNDATALTVECNTHEDCGLTRVCSKRHKPRCTAAYPIGITCNSDTDCKAKQICREGICWQEGSKLESVVQRDVCQLFLFSCSISSRVCQLLLALVAGENGMEEGEPCKKHAECNGYTICLYGTCTAAVPLNIDCTDDASCKEKDTGCKYAHCWLAFYDEQFDYDLSDSVEKMENN
ncbi:hypothetical protein T4B_11287 [Trichinella pseudospiralis]|uniref:DUF7107 domain-containing protein n=2 Tax=Trichinella pseudospiralis TaxID=6337 RepID=A0A0V1FI23_TRIPS|nr:hypothetical protein T4E_4683 [Trichinella pseudospiralis]KRY85690.1 hypothetical protein T4D_9184 [Trichinella pseudospiralis]KRZ21049.1 hypothetical protein T4B_11287 [Trichinella pseudospiralis]